MDLSLAPCTIAPADEDWQGMDDAALWHAAKAGVPHAAAELNRRETK